LSQKLSVVQSRLKEALEVTGAPLRVFLLEKILADARSSLSPTHYIVIEALKELYTAYMEEVVACPVRAMKG
jgi:hypothetical protein